jgi:hypothetical protein
MRPIPGVVVQGKVALDSVAPPEGAVRLPAALQAELEQALAEADCEEGISGDELLERLRKYG